MGFEDLPPRLRVVLRVCPFNGCWLYVGRRWSRNGYGRARDEEGRERQVHRQTWELEHGAICPTINIDHLCRCRPCANPAHLDAAFPVTNTRRGLAKLFRRPEEYD